MIEVLLRECNGGALMTLLKRGEKERIEERREA